MKLNATEYVDHQWGHVLTADGRLAHSRTGPDIATGDVWVDAISQPLSAAEMAAVTAEMDSVALDRHAPRPVSDRIRGEMTPC